MLTLFQMLFMPCFLTKDKDKDKRAGLQSALSSPIYSIALVWQCGVTTERKTSTMQGKHL